MFKLVAPVVSFGQAAPLPPPCHQPWASQLELVVKNLPANAGDTRDLGSLPGSGRSPGGGHGNPLQYSCLEHLMDRGAWQARAQGVTKDLDTTLQLSRHFILYV